MAAIVTEAFRRFALDQLEANVGGDSDNYYIAIGRSENWNDSDVATTPENKLLDELEFRHSVQSIKIAEDVSFVVPRYTWSSGTVYAGYDNDTSGHPETSFYVVTEENNIYICLERGLNADGSTKISTVKPTGQATSKFTTADGYTWKYLYSISPTKASQFLTANYMPIQYIDSAADAFEQAQFDVQAAATDGEVLNVVVTDGGTGYTSAPTITIEGDGSGATATADVSGGQVKRIRVTDNGSGYQVAKVNISGGGGSGAVARANLSPKNGIGANAKISLRAKALMFNSKPDGLEGGSFIVGNDFRQVAVLKNPTDYSGNAFVGNSASVLKKMTLSDPTGFEVDQEITGSTSGSTALIDYVDSDTIYFHQNLSTGFGSFDSDVGGIVSSAGNNTTLVSLIDSADIDPFSGEILYLENRSPVIRAETQTEDIKAIISL